MAVIPSTPGIRRSMSTTSGECSTTASTASAPSAAVATTSILRGAEDRAQVGAHHRLVVGHQHPDRHRTSTGRSALHLETSAGARPRVQRAADHLHALPQPAQPAPRAGRRERRVGRCRWGGVAHRDRHAVGAVAHLDLHRPRRARACARSSAPPARRGGPYATRPAGPRRPARAARARTGTPAATDASTSSRSSRRGAGGPTAGDAPPGSRPNTPTSSRSSSSACIPATRSASAACRIAGSVAVTSSAPACSTIRLTRWVTTSCISAASRARSSALACSASSCCSRSARSAFSRRPGEQAAPGGEVAARERGHRRVEQAERDRRPRRVPRPGRQQREHRRRAPTWSARSRSCTSVPTTMPRPWPG